MINAAPKPIFKIRLQFHLLCNCQFSNKSKEVDKGFIYYIVKDWVESSRVIHPVMESMLCVRDPPDYFIYSFTLPISPMGMQSTLHSSLSSFYSHNNCVRKVRLRERLAQHHLVSFHGKCRFQPESFKSYSNTLYPAAYWFLTSLTYCRHIFCNLPSLCYLQETGTGQSGLPQPSVLHPPKKEI